MKIARYISPLQAKKVSQTDCVVVGGGIAGLFTALQLSAYAKVTLVTKKSIEDSNTRWAQGGIAAVISEIDSPALHKQDTLMAGAGLCDPESVDILVHEGTDAVRQLIDFGIQFDKENGQIALTKEGAHSRRRILHAQGDATGAEIVRGLTELVLKEDNITVLENHYVLDIVSTEDRCHGVHVLTPEQDKIIIQGQAVVLATGGAGQLYRYTTNPDIATGDGFALAYRAGAQVTDMEFIQFHPTVLFYPDAPRFLISEAVRGEGAILRNTYGEPFMSKYHALGDLAPRDIVSRAILQEIQQSGNPYVYLDFTHESDEKIKSRFPTIYRTCLQYGLNLMSDWIPVAPAAHYIMGGVKTGWNGQTSVTGLYACGEVACTGVHGANRLASNSLSEAIVFGNRIVQHIREHCLSKSLPEGIKMDLAYPLEKYPQEGLKWKRQLLEKRLQLQKKMVTYAGLERNLASLQTIKNWIEQVWSETNTSFLQTDEQVEFVNMLTCSLLVVQSALTRDESRGGHYRSDFPQPNDSMWKKHIVLQRDKNTGEMRERITDVKPS